MEQEKINNNSDTSTAESDHNIPPAEGSAAAGRSYDCTFCKRGFTNAQALGGHMNIHRKDKAKAKKKKRNSEEEDPIIQSFNSSFFPQIAAAGYGQVPQRERPHVDYQVYMPSSNPNLEKRKNYEYCFFPVWRPHNLEDCASGNLRFDEDGDGDGEEEVDLELRLGRLF